MILTYLQKAEIFQITKKCVSMISVKCIFPFVSFAVHSIHLGVIPNYTPFNQGQALSLIFMYNPDFT